MTTDTEEEGEIGEVEVGVVETSPQAVIRGTPRQRTNPIHDDKGCVRNGDLMAKPPNDSVP
jgi:hypothetical protein